jgi:hypothetical protein
MFEKYDQYLNLGFSVDFWSDEGISHATSLLEKFTKPDWDCLGLACATRPTQWLVRCAETLGDNVSAHCFHVLILLLQAGDKEVTVSALDSINALSSMGLDISSHSESLLKAIEAIKHHASQVERMLLDALERKLTR